MLDSARRILQSAQTREGVHPWGLALAGLCAIVLLALFVQTLNASIARGETLRAQQRAALHMPAARVAATQAADEPASR
jgi:hypothetical protein